MKRFILIASIYILTLSVSVFAQEAENQRQKFDPKSDPYNDVKLASELAIKENKRILLDVGGEWCIWCHRLDGFIEENAAIKKYVEENYIVVKVNVSQENKNEKFLSQFPKIPGYPHFFVLESDGKFLHSQSTGELEKDKSYSSDFLMDFFKKWAPTK